MKKGILICLSFVVLIPLCFYLWMALGMVATSSAKSIDLECITQYKDNIKKNYSDIKKAKVYYKRGRLHIDFTASPKMSLDECKKVVKETNDFIEKDATAKPLRSMIFNRQLSIEVNFDLSEETYVLFERPNRNDSNASEKNNVWFMQTNMQNEQQYTRIEF